MDFLQNFHYKISGNLSSRHYLVFLHGLMGSGVNWQRVAAQFQDRYQILTFDQRGHGRSFQPKKGYDPKDFASDLQQILDELGWKLVDLVGHSMGGRNAITFATHYPQYVKSLVIEDISPSVKTKAIDSMKKLINSVPVPFASKKRALEFFKGEFLLQFDDREAAVNVGQFFYMNIVETSSGAADWRFFKPGILEALELGRRQDAWEMVESLKVPTLFIYGSDSGELSKEDVRRINETKSAKTRCINDSGHWVHFDQAEDFVEALKEFFT